MASYVCRATAHSLRRAAGGARMVSPSKPIANKQYAMNGSAYASRDRVDHYYNIARAQQRTIFPVQDPRIYEMNPPNGGINRPIDTGIWNGKVCRVAYYPGKSEKECVETGTSGSWWMLRETIGHIAAASDTHQEFLENLRYYLALGKELKLDSTKIIECSVAGPIAAYAGVGAATSIDYDQTTFPTLYGCPIIQQLFIPGIRNVANQPDRSVIASCFDIGATNTYDGVGAFNKFVAGSRSFPS